VTEIFSCSNVSVTDRGFPCVDWAARRTACSPSSKPDELAASGSGGKAQVRPTSRLGVLSHQSLLSILGAAEQTGSRQAILREAVDAFLLRGAYSGSKEELTPIAGDPIAAVPVLSAFVATSVNPSL
jgi:hypothetical protein